MNKNPVLKLKTKKTKNPNPFPASHSLVPTKIPRNDYNIYLSKLYVIYFRDNIHTLPINL